MSKQKPALEYREPAQTPSSLRTWQILLIILAIAGLIVVIVVAAFWYFVLNNLRIPAPINM